MPSLAASSGLACGGGLINAAAYELIGGGGCLLLGSAVGKGFGMVD